MGWRVIGKEGISHELSLLLDEDKFVRLDVELEQGDAVHADVKSTVLTVPEFCLGKRCMWEVHLRSHLVLCPTILDPGSRIRDFRGPDRVASHR